MSSKTINLLNEKHEAISQDLETPASGFQSTQYRKIEFSSTELINLFDKKYRDTIDENSSYKTAFERFYWQAAGKDYNTEKKTFTLASFKELYKDEFIRFTKFYYKNNLWSKFKALLKENQKDKDLLNAMRQYDYTVNIKMGYGTL